MNRKSIIIAGFAIIFAVSLMVVSNTFVDTSDARESTTVPRYSEICAHGHNGFDCKNPKQIVTISELQEKISISEQTVTTQLER